MLHLLSRAASLFASVIMENKVLNRIFYYPELLYRKFTIESLTSPGHDYQVQTLFR